MILLLVLVLFLIMGIGYFLAKRRFLIAALCFVIAIPAGYLAAVFVYVAFKPTRVIACRDGAALNACEELKADMSYDTGDGIFTLREMALSSGDAARFESCEISSNRFYSECVDTAGAKWTLAASWK